MNGCDGFENEKEGNGCPPEIKDWGIGSIERGLLSGAAKVSCPNHTHRHLPPAIHWDRSWSKSRRRGI